jgi:hypothetical protein
MSAPDGLTDEELEQYQLEAYHHAVEENVVHVGWHASYVDLAAYTDLAYDSPGDGRDFVPYLYTVGLSRKNRPDLIIAGHLGKPTMRVLTGHVVQAVLRARTAPPHGTTLRVGTDPGVPVVLIRCDSYVITDYMFDTDLHEQAPKAMQIVWPDPTGAYPWHLVYNPAVKYRQPLLGPAPTPAPAGERR